MLADEIFSMLMGDAVEPRKIFIEENAQYAEMDWQGACYNNAHGVVDVAFFHFLIDIYGDYLIYLSLLITHFFTDTTMAVEHRILKKVTIDDAVLADEIFSMLMGDAVEPRKILIRVEVHLVHGKQDTPLYGFQAVAHIWQGASVCLWATLWNRGRFLLRKTRSMRRWISKEALEAL